MNILQAGKHTVLGGVASQNQSGIARELVFSEVVSERRPVAIFLTDNSSEAEPLMRNFHVWRKARGKPNSGEGRIHFTDALHSARDFDALVTKLDKLWSYQPSPLLVRDTSHRIFTPDRWTAWATELARTYRAKVVSVVNMGVHPVIAAPLTTVAPADAHWEITDDQLRVTVKNVATGDAVKFIGRAVDGGMVFNAKQPEAAHV